jgi:hypothetical protein
MKSPEPPCRVEERGDQEGATKGTTTQKTDQVVLARRR